MAERRMFSKSVIDSDEFMDMPLSTQALYFHLAIRADDDGFLSNPKKIMRMICASEDDMKILKAKNFIIAFGTGIIVITHWKMHNYIRSDRYKETVHKEEKKLLSVTENGMYTFGIPDDNRLVYQMDTQDRSGKDSIGQDSSVKVNDDLSIINKLTEKEKAELKESCTDIDQLIRYTDAKIASRGDASPISDPFNYIKAIMKNEGWEKKK